MKVAEKNVQRAEENLRCASVGFQEGVMQSTDVMAAQTAWLNARTQQIDAIIDKKLAQTDLQKAMGTLQLQQGY
jgi:outer membrane protein TolC